MQNFIVDGAHGLYTLSENEQATSALCNDLVVAGQSAGVLNLDILIQTSRVSVERTVVESAGFAWAGTLQKNENGRSVTYARFRRAVRIAGDGNNMAVALPVLAPTAMEAAACEYVRQQMSKPINEAKWAALGKQPEPTPARDLIIERLRAEIATLELEATSQQS